MLSDRKRQYLVDSIFMMQTKTVTDCTTLPAQWNALILTEPTLPVSYDTVVTVKCKDGYSQKGGDKSVTCKGGTNFVTNKPICKPGKTF